MNHQHLNADVNTAHKPPSVLVPVFFVLAGAASLVAALLNDETSGFVEGIQVVGAVAFFVLGYVWYRRAK